MPSTGPPSSREGSDTSSRHDGARHGGFLSLGASAIRPAHQGWRRHPWSWRQKRGPGTGTGSNAIGAALPMVSQGTQRMIGMRNCRIFKHSNFTAGDMLRSVSRWAATPWAIAVIASTAHSFAPGLLAIILGLLAIVAWAVALLVSTTRALFRKTWKRAVALPGAFICAVPLIVLGALSGDYVHLAMLYPYYVAKVHEHSDWQTKEVRFAWGDDAITVLDGPQLRVLVYDASGKTVVGDRPDPETGGLRVDAQHLVGSFYLILAYPG
jgi:hypothetical protein